MGKTLLFIMKEGQRRLEAAGKGSSAFDARALLSFVTGIPFRELPLHYRDLIADATDAATRCGDAADAATRCGDATDAATRCGDAADAATRCGGAADAAEIPSGCGAAAENKQKMDLEARYYELIRRRTEGEPLQYITGEQEFMGLEFHVDDRVLIPRLDTEILAEEAVKLVRARLTSLRDQNLAALSSGDGAAGHNSASQSQPGSGNAESAATIRVLDLCCGSGAIGLSIAALSCGDSDHFISADTCEVVLSDISEDALDVAKEEVVLSDISEDALDVAKEEVVLSDISEDALDVAKEEVVLSDISEDALDVAKENAEALGLSDRVRFVKSDLFEALGQEGFDVIVSNPPYIRSDVIGTLDVEVRGHEPMLALNGGADGLDVYRRIAEEAPKHLRAGGVLLMEIGCDQADDVTRLLESVARPAFGNIRVIRDLAGLDRVIVAET